MWVVASCSLSLGINIQVEHTAFIFKADWKTTSRHRLQHSSLNNNAMRILNLLWNSKVESEGQAFVKHSEHANPIKGGTVWQEGQSRKGVHCGDAQSTSVCVFVLYLSDHSAELWGATALWLEKRPSNIILPAAMQRRRRSSEQQTACSSVVAPGLRSIF